MKVRLLFFLAIILLRHWLFLSEGLGQSNSFLFSNQSAESSKITVGEYVDFLKASDDNGLSYNDHIATQINAISTEDGTDYEVASGINERDPLMGLTSSQIERFNTWDDSASSPLMMFGSESIGKKSGTDQIIHTSVDSHQEHEGASLENPSSTFQRRDLSVQAVKENNQTGLSSVAFAKCGNYTASLLVPIIFNGTAIAFSALKRSRSFITANNQMRNIVTMRAIQIKNPGPPEVLQISDVIKPSAKKNGIVVKNELIGINYVDTYYRKGSYAVQKLPFIPGMEGVGMVEEIGEGVQNIMKGSRVAYAMQLGSYAEFTEVPINRVYCLPKEISSECAITHFLQGMTATFLSNMLAKVELDSMSTILFRGAGCGVGKILLPFLKKENINVIATTRSPEKVESLIHSGAKDVVLDVGDAEHLCRTIKTSSMMSGAPIIYDSIGGSETWKFLPCMKERGLYVLFGQSAGAAPAIDPQSLRQHGSLFVTRPSLTHYMSSFEETKLLGDQLFRNINSIGNGALNEVDAVFALEDAAKAHEYLELRKNVGKVILRP